MAYSPQMMKMSLGTVGAVIGDTTDTMGRHC